MPSQPTSTGRLLAGDTGDSPWGLSLLAVGREKKQQQLWLMGLFLFLHIPARVSWDHLPNRKFLKFSSLVLCLRKPKVRQKR